MQLTVYDVPPPSRLRKRPKRQSLGVFFFSFLFTANVLLLLEFNNDIQPRLGPTATATPAPSSEGGQARDDLGMFL
jgi:hypothetical protein